METVEKPMAAPLPFPLRPLKVDGGFVDEYLIPPDMKGEVLRKLYPFVPVPSMSALMLDVHEEKRFRVCEFRVLRGYGMNWLVSPYFPTSGGTVIDWEEVDEK
ncbi:MAG TPA: hypothetical protein DCZ92_08690 [Elusimicrobia bacterium]|nr:MAG: hypothetical protein A2016_01830 [Elusimicrobia bacterium GWF2_62_30]HBA60882.1 hypothetical protein [Elusimicrobiota bacterium]